VEPDTLFEGVTQYLDDAGIYARKVRADELEAYMSREGGVIKGFVDEKVGEEKTRAEEAEAAITLAADDLVAEERERAETTEQALARNKANMFVIPGPGRLMDAPVGANINYISFNTSAHPVLVDSYIQCAGGEFKVENDEFFFLPTGGNRVVFYTEGDWTAAAAGVFEAPGLNVAVNYNANGGVWESRYGSHLADLEEVRNTLRAEITAEQDRAEQEEATIKAAIPGTAAAKVAEHNASGSAHADIRNLIGTETAAAVSAHNTSGSAHEDIRNLLLPFPEEDGSYKLLVTDGMPEYAPLAMPEAPAADGTYNLVVTDGVPSWEAVV
jgi:hypothetical protein